MNNEEPVKEQPKAEQKDEEKNEQIPKEASQELPKVPAMRQILIETDGNRVTITKNESVGSLELISILETLLQAVARR